MIVGSFQDELPSLATWGQGFAAAFHAQMGYDIVPRLPELWDGRGDVADRLRSDYHRVRGALAEDAFFKPLFDWHYLMSGDRETVHRAGMSVRGWTVPEFDVPEEEWENHIIEDL